ncbi:MAG: hypothetical protein ACP6IU_08220 [Candidatus Asgardarchaeia archaeon]
MSTQKRILLEDDQRVIYAIGEISNRFANKFIIFVILTYAVLPIIIAVIHSYSSILANINFRNVFLCWIFSNTLYSIVN